MIKNNTTSKFSLSFTKDKINTGKLYFDNLNLSTRTNFKSKSIIKNNNYKNVSYIPKKSLKIKNKSDINLRNNYAINQKTNTVYGKLNKLLGSKINTTNIITNKPNTDIYLKMDINNRPKGDNFDYCYILVVDNIYHNLTPNLKILKFIKSKFIASILKHKNLNFIDKKYNDYKYLYYNNGHIFHYNIIYNFDYLIATKLYINIIPNDILLKINKVMKNKFIKNKKQTNNKIIFKKSNNKNNNTVTFILNTLDNMNKKKSIQSNILINILNESNNELEIATKINEINNNNRNIINNYSKIARNDIRNNYLASHKILNKRHVNNIKVSKYVDNLINFKSINDNDNNDKLNFLKDNLKIKDENLKDDSIYENIISKYYDSITKNNSNKKISNRYNIKNDNTKLKINEKFNIYQLYSKPIIDYNIPKLMLSYKLSRNYVINIIIIYKILCKLSLCQNNTNIINGNSLSITKNYVKYGIENFTLINNKKLKNILNYYKIPLNNIIFDNFLNIKNSMENSSLIERLRSHICLEINNSNITTLDFNLLLNMLNNSLKTIFSSDTKDISSFIAENLYNNNGIAIEKDIEINELIKILLNETQASTLFYNFFN